MIVEQPPKCPKCGSTMIRCKAGIPITAGRK